jgi:hypothetical protein
LLHRLDDHRVELRILVRRLHDGGILVHAQAMVFERLARLLFRLLLQLRDLGGMLRSLHLRIEILLNPLHVDRGIGEGVDLALREL